MEPLGSDALAGVKALVVDDNEDAAQMVAAFLAIYGAEVRTAFSARDALSQFDDWRPNALLSDIDMPGEDGLELIRRIRAKGNDIGGLVPALALTGGASAEETLGAGYHVHLTKPVDPNRLVDVLRSFFGDATSRPADRAASTWTIKTEGRKIILRLHGDVAARDMVAATTAVAALLGSSDSSYEVVSDLRELQSFVPSAGYLAQRSVWAVRGKIEKVTVVGGPPLARLVSKTACWVLGVPCTLQG